MYCGIHFFPTRRSSDLYDPARDYQTGEARASSGEQFGSELQQQLPAVLDASGAKSLAQRMLARQWATRDRLTLHLPPSRRSEEHTSELQSHVNLVCRLL